MAIGGENSRLFAQRAHSARCATKGWVRTKQAHVPNVEKWAHVLPETVAAIHDKVQRGFDVAFVDGSRELQWGG